MSEHLTSKRRLSVFERSFRCADIWLRNRFHLKPGEATAEHEKYHIGYRCGWLAGYERARREAMEGKK